MKKIIIALVTVFMLSGAYRAESQISTGISFNTFYTQLSPYGRWIDNPAYGQVWIANANGFEPYSNDGHWEFTNYGWTWVSDYSWGWAPFHYGRWAYIPAYGWAWVPGYEWAPAWVSWCQYDDFYGWAPMAPGWGLNMGFGNIPFNYWRFVRHQYINDQHVYRHYSRPVINANAYNNVTVINNTQVNNNVTYASGPALQEVERITRKKIAPKQVTFTAEQTPTTKTVKNQVRIFKPDTKLNNGINTEPAATVKQPVKQAPVTETESGTAVQPVPTVKPGINAPSKDQPVTLIKNEQQPATTKQQPLQQIKDREQNEAAQQQLIRKEQDTKISQQEATKQQQLKEQQAAQQNEIRKQQEADRLQQLRDQQAAQQQAAQQNELRRQQQEQLRKQQQQEQLRQQKMQQQQIRKAEREQKAFPQQQVAPAKEQPVRLGKKEKN